MAMNSSSSRRGFGAAGIAALLIFGALGDPADDFARAMDTAGSRTTNADAEATVTGGSSEVAGSGNPLQGLPVTRLSATRDRPLFSASRRPPPPVVSTAPPAPPPILASPPAPEAPPFTLVGTIIGEHDRIGIFFNEGAKTTTRIREGDHDSGWILRSLDPRSAVLEGEGRMVTLGMPEPGSAGTVATDASGAPRISGFVKPRKTARDNDGL
jgi:hypothetical protein